MKKLLFEHAKNGEIDIIKFSQPTENNESLNNIFRQIEDISKKRKIILDLGEITFVNSTFIGYIFHLYETSKNLSGFVYLVNINPKIMDILNLTGILDHIPYYKTTEEALKTVVKN